MRSLLIFVAAILLYSCSSTTAPQVTVGAIAGKVVDTNLSVISGAVVSTDPPTSQFLSAQDGTFKFEHVLPGIYLLTAQKALDQSGTASVRVLAGQTSYADIILTPFGKNEGLVKGVVLNPDRVPIADATVTTIPPTTTATTGADGSFTLAHIPTGNYSLVAEKEGLGRTSTLIAVEEGETLFTEVVLYPKPDFDFDALIACYPFEANGNDLSENARHFTLTDASFTDSRFNDGSKALLANGTSTVGKTSFSPAFNMSALTIAVWIKALNPNLKTNPIEGMDILAHYQNGSKNGYALFFFGSVLEWFYGNGSDFTYCTVNAGVAADDTWHLIVVTVDQSGSSIFIDGVGVASGPWKTTPGTTTQNLPLEICFNSTSPGGKLYNGAIDDLRLYDKVLSSSDIQLLWNDR